MPLKPPYLAFDLGASSGRAVLGNFHRGQLTLEEIHRFQNKAIHLHGGVYWDFFALWENILASLRICAEQGHTRLAGIGLDTWGLDSGLIGRDGKLLGNCFCYRDPRTEKLAKTVAAKISDSELSRLTGSGFQPIWSLGQMIALKNSGSGVIDIADKWLMMPDLFRYFLCGQQAGELTIASTSQMLNVRTRKWIPKLFRLFNLPRRIMPEVVEPGTVAGQLLPELCQTTGIKSAPVITVAGHDTAAAAAAAPQQNPDTPFISLGTWAIFGLINDGPITSDKAMECGLVNEFGLDCMLTVRNLMGLYLFENLRRAWQQKGVNMSYTQMVKLAAAAKPFKVILDVNSPSFFLSHDPEVSVKTFLRRTGQKPTLTKGEVIRVLLEGLAFSCRESLIDMKDVTGRHYPRLQIIGGGIRNRLLCQMITDALGIPVTTGPAEATTAGNICTQALATGQLSSVSDIAKVIKSSFKLTEYKPRATEQWEKQFPAYQRIREKSKRLN